MVDPTLNSTTTKKISALGEVKIRKFEPLKKHFQEIGDFESVRALIDIEHLLTRVLIYAIFVQQIAKVLHRFSPNRGFTIATEDIVHDGGWAVAMIQALGDYKNWAAQTKVLDKFEEEVYIQYRDLLEQE
jgi:hypothetical protein